MSVSVCLPSCILQEGDYTRGAFLCILYLTLYDICLIFCTNLVSPLCIMYNCLIYLLVRMVTIPLSFPLSRFLVRVSYLEIYNEEVRDLLRQDQSVRLEVKERPDVGVYVKDLLTHVVHNAGEMDRIMTLGNKNSKCV